MGLVDGRIRMTERFVYGFVASTEALFGLVGSGLDTDEVLGEVPDEFVEMFDDEFDGEISVQQCVTEFLAGRLDPERTYPYARAVEPLLMAVAEPVGTFQMLETYYLANDSFGRWNPVLKRIGLPRLGKLWAAPNLTFPWPDASTERSDWPCITEFGPAALAEVETELTADWRGALAELPDDVLVEDDGPVRAQFAREELAESLEAL